jgi:hypothetical protein
MGMKIDPGHMRQMFTSGRVEVNRIRYRGDERGKYVFVLYERSAIGPSPYGLFVAPTSFDYTSMELGGRLLEDSTTARAHIILAGGTMTESAARIDFVDQERCSLDNVAHLMAEGFFHKVMDDFRRAKLSYKDEPVIGCSSIKQLLKLLVN